MLSDKASGFASQDFDRLKSLVQEKGDLRLGQKMRVVMTDGTTKEMTGREYQKLKADSEMKEAERIAKEKQKARSKEQEKSAYGERLYN